MLGRSSFILLIIPTLGVLGFLGGRWSASRANGSPPELPSAPSSPSTPPASVPPRTQDPSRWRPIGANPNFAYTRRQQEFMRKTAEQLIAEDTDPKGFVDKCVGEYFQGDDQARDKCKRIVAIIQTAHVRNYTAQQRFLRGEIDQDEYQSEAHKFHLQVQIMLEQFLSYQDMLHFPSQPPGTDVFLTVMGSVLLPNDSQFKMGSEILSQRAQP